MRLIAVFKLLKAVLLIAVGIGVLKLVHRNLSEVLAQWVEAVNIDPANRLVDAALAKAANLQPKHIKELGVGSFLYAGLFLIEGTGLWLGRRWGEWVTIVITGSLLPIEIYEIFRHASTVKFLVLTLNAAILAYLIYMVRTERQTSGKP